MPLYEFDLTVPADTAQASAVSRTMPIDPGIVTRLSVQFPAGCVGMVHCQILRGLHVVMPNNAEATIKGDNVIVESEEELDVTHPPLFLIARAWSPDT
jgi:hypothetical protein